MPTQPITPLKLGIKFEPPQVLLIYRSRGKLRQRLIPCKNMDILTDIRLYTKSFKKDEKNKAFFEKISENKLEKLFFILQDNMKGYTLKESLQRAKKYDSKKANPSTVDDLDITEQSNVDKSDLDEYKNAITKFKYDESESKNEEVEVKSKKPCDKKEPDEDEVDDDFHDTDEEEEEEEERNPPSVSTIEEVKKKKNLFETIISSPGSSKAAESGKTKSEIQEEGISKSTALDLLSTQLSSVKARIYDFEDDVEDELDDVKSKNEDDGEENEEEKIETAKGDNDDFDDDSF